jgi:parallel beta-helix repeat protein
VFTQNTFSGEGIIIHGGSLEHWTTHTIDASNRVNGKPICYWKNRTGGVTPSNAGQVILANCQDIDIRNHNFTDYSGILLGYSSNNKIIGNTVSNNIYGIYLSHSHSNNVSGNIVSNNFIEGVYLRNSNNNNITNNYLSWNGHAEIIIWDAGITLESSLKNRIFHNTLVDNILQARDDRNDNYWDNGYPSGGNYWSDYWGEDLYYGPNQDIPGSDGIGDTPHGFDPNSFDRYPLINQYYPPTGPNSPPVANAGTDLNIYLGETAHLNGSNSYDPDGDALSYYWNFGDGSHYSQDLSPTCAYTKTGEYNVTLTVWDNYRNVDIDTCKVTVLVIPNFPPIIEAIGDITAHECDNITFHANASDANGDPLTYDWDFGDGNTSSLANPSHVYQDNGLYNVSLTVTDDSGASTNASILVNVLNVPPVAFLGPDITVNEGDSVLLSASATDASPVDILSYNWDLDNDGIFNDAVGQNVSWILNDDSQFNVSVNVSDDDGGSDCAYILVTVNNIAPTVSLGISFYGISVMGIFAINRFRTTHIPEMEITLSPSGSWMMTGV